MPQKQLSSQGCSSCPCVCCVSHDEPVKELPCPAKLSGSTREPQTQNYGAKHFEKQLLFLQLLFVDLSSLHQRPVDEINV